MRSLILSAGDAKTPHHHKPPRPRVGPETQGERCHQTADMLRVRGPHGDNSVQCPLCGHEFRLSQDQSATGVSGAGRTLFVFQREGECWFIGYEADTFRLKDTKGLRYLHTLLGSPGREILALDHIGVEPGVDVLCRVWALGGNGATGFA